MAYSLGNALLKNYLIASSSPLTESPTRLRCCYEAGFSAAIIKSAADYSRSGNGYGRRVVYVDDGYYADASFEREIFTLEEGLRLYNNSVCNIPSDMLLIPSVSASSLEPEDWIKPCIEYEKVGATLLQLDFFYLGTLPHNQLFFEKFQNLLTQLVSALDCVIMPKVNLNFDPAQSFEIIKESGVKVVSLLDSMREDPDPRFGLHKGTTSYFGRRQLPFTRQYLRIAKEKGLEVCAGGGITTSKDVELLLNSGANAVQIASFVLNNGFSAVPELLGYDSPLSSVSKTINHNPWCDHEDGAECDNCGACRKPVMEYYAN